MRIAHLVAGLMLAPASCRVVTLVEVETRVETDGSGVRTLRASSRWEDGRDEATALPGDFLPGDGYTVALQGPDRYEASAAFARLDRAPAPFAFGAGGRRTAFPAEFRAVDWGLFTLVHYAESLVDSVEPELLRATLEEAVTVLLETADAACASFFGADFDATLLHERLRGDLRAAARDLATILWQEIYANDAGPAQILARGLPRLKAIGLDLDPAWFEDWEAGEPRVRAEVAAWVEAQLRPRRAGERTPLPVGLETALFDGAFGAAFGAALAQRFDGAPAAEAWVERTIATLKGSFGGGRDDVLFRLRLRMPGSLLRTDGWLESDGATFLEFAGREAFPRGRGIRCASVVWRAEALAALPAFVEQDNSTAISWTRALGDGPDGAPAAAPLELLRACVAARGFGPLRAAAEDPEHAEAAAAARLLAWFEGARQ